MAGLRDPKDRPAGMPQNQESPKKDSEPVFAFNGDSEQPPANVVIVGKVTGHKVKVRRLDNNALIDVDVDTLIPPRGKDKPKPEKPDKPDKG